MSDIERLHPYLTPELLAEINHLRERMERYKKALEQIHAGKLGATLSGSQCATIARTALREPK